MSAGWLRLRRDLAGTIGPAAWPAGYRCRDLAPADASAVHRLLEAGYADGGGQVAPLAQWWPALRDDPELDYALCPLALDAAGAIAGVAQCWRSGFVKDLVVHPGHRGRGLGTALLLTAFRRFAARGIDRVDLKVEVDNPGAIRFYRRLGMREAKGEP